MNGCNRNERGKLFIVKILSREDAFPIDVQIVQFLCYDGDLYSPLFIAHRMGLVRAAVEFEQQRLDGDMFFQVCIRERSFLDHF